MPAITRPKYIASFLETISANKDAEVAAELNTYLSHLEARQPQRPDRVATILEDIQMRYPADESAQLSTYISNLEANKRSVVEENESESQAAAVSIAPIWSHQRSIRRRHHREERAAQKLNHY